MPGPYIGQQSQRMCVVCGRLTANDLVCDLCQNKQGPNSNAAHRSNYSVETRAVPAEEPSSSNFWWFVAACLGVMVNIVLLYVYFARKDAANQQSKPVPQIDRPLANQIAQSLEPPKSQTPSAPASQPNTTPPAQPPSNPVNSGARGTQSTTGFTASSGQAQMASTDNIVRESVGVSGPSVFMDTFRQAYEKDLENKKYQTWDTYWEAVQSFYSGSGWVATGNRALAHIKGDLRQTVRQKWDNLGVLIASEASKSSFTRRINPSDVTTFMSTLQNALSEDQGDGATIVSKIDEVSKAASELKS